MIEVENGIENLLELERWLESQLALDYHFSQSLTISCALREGQLMVLIHCPEATQPHSQDLFNRIRAIIARDRPSQLKGLQLYLIIHGQRILPEADGVSALVHLAKTLNLSAPLRQKRSTPALLNLRDFQTQVGLRLRRWCAHLGFRPGLAIGSGLIVAVSGLYALSRPCVIGRCRVLPEAEQRASEVEQSLRHAATLSDLQTAQAQLNQSMRQLQAIPPWSSYHDQAQLRLNHYQQTDDQLSQGVAALNWGDQAQALAQKPTPTDSQRLKQLWQSALSPLSAIPASSPIFSLAQAKRQEYQARLSQIHRDVRQAEQAIALLHRAEEAATLAQSRQAMASSLQDWQLVTATWETALKRLRQVPADSSAAEGARQAINRYLPFWVKASKRQQMEQAAQTHYQKAIQAAQSAQSAQSQQQDTQAVRSWQQAIAHLSAISPQSQQFSATQTLLPSYRLALNQSQAQRDRQTERQSLRQELDRLCQNPEKICDYRLDNEQIRLTLSPTYLSQVWNRSLEAQAQANVPTQMAILNQVTRLEQNLQWLSQKTGLPVAVYNPQGFLISRYERGE